MKEKKIIFISIFVFLSISYLFSILKNNKNKRFLQDDVIFFKTFHFSDIQKNNRSNSNNRNGVIDNYYNNHNEKIQYRFKVSYKNIDFKEIYLQDTINKETLVNGKVAPRY